LGSRDVYFDENAGRSVADEIARVVHQLPYVDLHSRQDYHFYIAGKRRLLETAFKNPEIEYLPRDYDRMVQQIDPVAIGRDLGVDVVITGRITDSYMAMNRTINWTWSRVNIEIDIFDIRSGAKLDTLKLEEIDQLSSPLRLVRTHLEKMLPDFDNAIGGQELK